MGETRLVLVEGVIGSGRTTTAEQLATSNTLAGSDGSTVVVQISGQRITTASRAVVAIAPAPAC